MPIPLATPRIDAALTSAATGQNYTFCRYLASGNEHDYIIDTQRAAPLADLIPLHPHELLDAAVAAYRARGHGPAAKTVLAHALPNPDRTPPPATEDPV